MSQATVGLDIGGTKILGLLVDPKTGVVHSRRRVLTPRTGPELVSSLVGIVNDLASDLDPTPIAVGVGVAGLVDSEGVLRTSPNLPEVTNLDLATLLRNKIGVPVVVDNDATTATVAEHRLGAARSVENFLYVALGTGIGGGLVLDGQVRRGAHGFGGEFGHMVVDTNGPACGCGIAGCWEQLASGSALGRMARAAVAAGKAKAVVARAGSAPIQGEHLAAAALAGDPDSLVVLDEFARWIAIGLAALTNVLDPEKIVIGGGVAEIGAVLLDRVRADFVTMPMGADYRPSVPVVSAHFGEDSGAIGAALLAGETSGGDLRLHR